jgi:hypothetical protein
MAHMIFSMLCFSLTYSSLKKKITKKKLATHFGLFSLQIYKKKNSTVPNKSLEVSKIRGRNVIQEIFPKKLQMDPRVHQSLMVLELLSLSYMQ